MEPVDRRLLIFGCGYSASRFAALYGNRFSRMTGTVREPAARAAAPGGVRILRFDGVSTTPLVSQAVADATHVLVSIPPDDQGDPVFRLFGSELARAPAIQWIGYLSTVGVYGDFGGEWVDETTRIRPTAERNRRRALAERAWIDCGTSAGKAVQVFRLSGIYGPGQNAVDNLRRGLARRIVKPGQVFNRIHVDDIAGAIAAGMDRPGTGPIINVTDDEPAPPQDVVAYAAGLLGLAPPDETAFDEADLSPMGRSFYGENKRVSNRLLREGLGYQLSFPTYREGMASFV